MHTPCYSHRHPFCEACVYGGVGGGSRSDQTLTLYEVVLQGSSRQDHSPAGLDGVHGLGHSRRLVLEDVALVTDHKVRT